MTEYFDKQGFENYKREIISVNQKMIDSYVKSFQDLGCGVSAKIVKSKFEEYDSKKVHYQGKIIPTAHYFPIITDIINKRRIKKANEMHGSFEPYGNPYRKIAFEIALYNPNGKKRDPENSKVIKAYILKYKRTKDGYECKAVTDRYFRMCMKRYLKRLEKSGIDKFYKRSITDYLQRFFCPSRFKIK